MAHGCGSPSSTGRGEHGTTTMFSIKGLTLKTSIAAATTLLFVLFAAISCFFAIWKMQKELRHTVGMQQYALATAIGNNINSKAERARSSLGAATSELSPGIAENPVEAQRYIDERVTLHSIFDLGVSIFDRNARLIAHSPFNPSIQSLPPKQKRVF